MKQATQAGKTRPPTPSQDQSPPRIHKVVIRDPPIIVFLDLSQDESEDEELTN